MFIELGSSLYVQETQLGLYSYLSFLSQLNSCGVTVQS